MRKRIIATTFHPAATERKWLDLETTASVEIISEDKAFPIESALLRQGERGWRAAGPGVQTIRLIFDHPQKLRQILLIFEETEIKRTQEFVLRWSPSRDGFFREIVRQQWNFSPSGSVREIENYVVELSEVLVLELIIVPDQSNGDVGRRCKVSVWRETLRYDGGLTTPHFLNAGRDAGPAAGDAYRSRVVRLRTAKSRECLARSRRLQEAGES